MPAKKKPSKRKEAKQALTHKKSGQRRARRNGAGDQSPGEELLRIQRDLAIVLSSTSGLDQALACVLEAACKIDGIDCGGVYLVDDATGELNLVAYEGLPHQFVEAVRHYPVDSSRTRLVMAGKPVYRPYRDVVTATDGIKQSEPLRAFAVVPVHYQGRVVAAVNVASHTHDTIPGGARDAVEAVATQLGGVIARVKAETKLRDSEQRYRLLFERNLAGVYRTKLDGTILDCNESMAAMFGYASRAELLSCRASDLYFEATDRATFIAQLQENGALENSELRMRRKDGTPIDILENVLHLPDESGELTIIQGTMVDITDRKRAEQRLRLLSSAVEQSSEGVAVVDPEGHLLHLNKAFAAMHGYAREELAGKHLSVFHSAEQMPSVNAAIRQITETGEFSGEIWHVRRDGTAFPTSMRNSLLRDEVGNPTGIIATARDITERKQTEEALRRAHDELEKRVEERTAELAKSNKELQAEITERRRAEEALRESERRSRAIFDQTFQFIGLMTPDGTLIEANKTALGFAGIDESDVLGKPFWETPWWTHSPEQQNRLRDAVTKAAGGQFVRFEATHPAGDGSLHHVDFSLKPVKDEQGNVTLLIPEGRDITERKRAEKELSRHREHLEELVKDRTAELQQEISDRKQVEAMLRKERDKAQRYLDIAGVIFVAINDKGNVTLINQKGCAVLGCNEQDIVGKNWFDNFIPERLRGNVISVSKKLLSGELDAAECHENPILTRSGEERLIAWHNTTLRDDDGNTVGHLSSGEDITDRKRAEEALRESEERFRQIAENSNQVFWLTDWVKKELLYVSPAYERVYGRSCQSLYENRRSWLEGVHPEDRTRVGDIFAQKGARGEYTEEEYRIVRPDDSVLWIHDRSFPIRDTAGKVYRWVGVAEDITARKRAEEEKETLEAQLRQAQKMEAIGQLAGGIAHDFNNILTAILGNVELMQAELRTELPADDTLVIGLEQIDRAGQRAASLTRHLLAFSRHETVEPKVLDLNQILRELGPLLPHLLGEQVSLDLALGPNIRRIRADAGQIEQVLMNLVVNAHDAMPDGGTVTVETTNVLLDEEYCATHPALNPGPHVVLAVSDSGEGMDEKTRERVFEPFFTTKPLGHGTGLGLSTVYGIVKQAGGDVTVYSEPGHGTTFKVYLPAVDAPIETTPAQAADDIIPGGDETVLVCEDEDDVRGLARRILEGAGYTVLSADNGAHGVQLAAEHGGPIHLLVTDVIMPGMDGGKVAEALRPTRPETKVLYISGYTANVLARRGIARNDVTLLEKPFTLRSLLERVRQVLDCE